ncbi:MAG: cell division protein ZapD [Gammaproteobacteria bacterium]
MFSLRDTIIYEQPLNERIRTFLRLEHLFQTVDHRIESDVEWDNRETLTTLLDITDLLSRSDIKAELIKELERHATTLTVLENNPGVDRSRLNSILQDITSLLEILRDSTCQPGQLLKQDDLVTSVKQRSTMPGGSCNFDLPGYHYWINRPAQARKNDLAIWQDDLHVIRKSIALSLHMIRNSTNPTIELAETGFFQKPMESNLSCQLIRVIVPRDLKYYPEISGGKHRFTIRFMEQNQTNSRPTQTQETVEFELHCCIL